MEDKTASGTTAATVKPTENTASPKKAVKSKAAKTQKAKASHPPTSEMVNNAIKELKDRKGSSVQAIKKYIVSTYKVDGEKLAPFIKRYLKTAVTSGTIVQTKGKGASGSFKLSTSKTEAKPKPQRVLKSKTAGTKSVEKKSTATARKPAAAKKPAAKKPAPASQKPAAAKKTTKAAATEKVKAPKTKAAQPKTLSKTKKTAKAPAAKTKTPKPKKAAAPKTVKAAKK